MIERLRNVFAHRETKVDPVVADLVQKADAQTEEVKAAVKGANEVSKHIFEDFRKQDGFFKGQMQ